MQKNTERIDIYIYIYIGSYRPLQSENLIYSVQSLRSISHRVTKIIYFYESKYFPVDFQLKSRYIRPVETVPVCFSYRWNWIVHKSIPYKPILLSNYLKRYTNRFHRETWLVRSIIKPNRIIFLMNNRKT